MKKILLIVALFIVMPAYLFAQSKNSQLQYLPEKVNAKGTLVIEGGGDRISVILKTIIKYGGGDNAKLLVVPFASGVAEETGQNQSKEFRNLGCKNANYIFCAKEAIDAPENLAKLDGVTAIFFSGGDQLRLVDFLAGTKFFERIKQIYRNGGVISGTSAGAAIMSRIMLTGRSITDTTDDSHEFNYIRHNDVEIAKGFGFLNNIIVDQHFITRRRQVRLINVLLDHPNYRGIGIDEESAVVVKPNSTIEVIGNSNVMLFEPYKAVAGKGHAKSFKLTILYPGDTYNL
ncbi:MAG TPA: cyanophycinase [Candidatus Egerieousia sp.]|nr:cyanophycinase [Candidatus Egerieousia sp.]